jgi:hypothetical protein
VPLFFCIIFLYYIFSLLFFYRGLVVSAIPRCWSEPVLILYCCQEDDCSVDVLQTDLHSICIGMLEYSFCLYEYVDLMFSDRCCNGGHSVLLHLGGIRVWCSPSLLPGCSSLFWALQVRFGTGAVSGMRFALMLCEPGTLFPAITWADFHTMFWAA